MADHAHNTPSTGRRRLGAGLLAIATGSVLTSGVAAGAAASVADLMPTDSDAQLIALCDEFVSLEQARYFVFDGPNAVLDDREAARVAAPLETRMSNLLDEMQAPRATTAAGILARAKALTAHNGSFGFSFDHPNDTHAGRLLAYLMRDAAGIGGPDLIRIAMIGSV